MKWTMINYIVLSLIAGCSFLAVCTFDFYPNGPYDESLDSLRLLTPGILFSFFIIFIQRSDWTIGKLILLFIILLILYGVCLVAGWSSWGVGVPFAGGIGAFVIRKLFYQGAQLLDHVGQHYLKFGFIAGLAGLVFFYVLLSFWTVGVGFGFILAIWQVVFGILWIKEKRIKSTSA